MRRSTIEPRVRIIGRHGRIYEVLLSVACTTLAARIRTLAYMHPFSSQPLCSHKKLLRYTADTKPSSPLRLFSDFDLTCWIQGKLWLKIRPHLGCWISPKWEIFTNFSSCLSTSFSLHNTPASFIADLCEITEANHDFGSQLIHIAYKLSPWLINQIPVEGPLSRDRFWWNSVGLCGGQRSIQLYSARDQSESNPVSILCYVNNTYY